MNIKTTSLLENLETLTSDETPDSSWYQYLDYSHNCGGHGMRLYCSQVTGTSHCTYHCGSSVQ